MLLSGLIDEVYTETNRPDLIAETSSAVRAATLLVHHSDFYSRDLFETGIKFDTAAYQQSLEVGIIPQYRKIKYLRKYDNIGSVPGSFLTILTSAELLDSYGVNKENVAYEAGSAINMRSNTLLEYMLLGAYVSPFVTSLNFNSWIADNYPWTIIYKAASTVSTSVGNLERANSSKKLFEEQFSTFQAFALATVGE